MTTPANDIDSSPASTSAGISAPFRYRVFRNVWITGVISNLGTHVQAVGAAWAMTQLTTNSQTVASVQSITMLPMMLFALLAGAIADLFDRRRVALLGLLISLIAAAALAVLYNDHRITPPSLLALCFIVALGNTLYGPSWQSSVREQVAPEDLPPAIALNSISYNVGRSLGPAVGGVIVAAAGATAAFAANAFSFIPIMIALLCWKRTSGPKVATRETLGRAVWLGIAYILNAPSIRTVLIRVVLGSLGGGAILALLPVLVKSQLGGNALMFGFLLGAFGLGAIIGALFIPTLRRRYSTETIIRSASVGVGVALIVIGLSRWSLLTALALLPAGCCWTICSSTFNVSIQLAAPRWVSGRAVSTYQMGIAGGTAIGSWLWGGVADAAGVATALLGAGLFMIVAQLYGFRWPMPAVGGARDEVPEAVPDPEISVPVQGRNGPITIMVHYRIATNDVAEFRSLMLEVRLSRRRNGAAAWSLGRDVVNPERWVERYHFATWTEYLLFRNRPTISERRLFGRVRRLQIDGSKPMVQRLLDRPTEDMDPTDGNIVAGDPVPWGAS
jgi:MFS family permease